LQEVLCPADVDFDDEEEGMNTEFLDALKLLRRKGLRRTICWKKIRNAIVIAVSRDARAAEDSVVEIDPKAAAFT
jgi:hypothetical protein